MYLFKLTLVNSGVICYFDAKMYLSTICPNATIINTYVIRIFYRPQLDMFYILSSNRWLRKFYTLFGRFCFLAVKAYVPNPNIFDDVLIVK